MIDHQNKTMIKIRKYLFFVAVSFTIHSTVAQKKTIYKDSAVINFFRRTNGWIAGDGAFTVPLSDGRILWLMGDSHIDDYDPATHTIPCLFQVHNAALLQPYGDWNWKHTKTLVDDRKGDKSFFKDTANHKIFYWPTSGIQLKDTVYVYYSGIKLSKEGLGFAVTGKDMLVKLKFPEMKVVGFHHLQNFNKIGFGDGFVLSKNKKYVFVFGYKHNTETKKNDMYVARFPSDKPYTLWQFWNGKRWSTNILHAKPISRNVGFTPMMCKVKNRYILVSSEPSIGCDQGKKIYVAASKHPTGPFSRPRAIYTIDDTLQGHYPFFYVPVAHPALINNKGELLITYNVNGYGKCIEGCVDNRMNPDHYRPRGIRVPLGLIDSSLSPEK